MNQLSSVMILPIDGGIRVSYIYNEIDKNTGDIISSNKRGNFVAVDSKLLSNIEAVYDFIRKNKLAE